MFLRRPPLLLLLTCWSLLLITGTAWAGHPPVLLAVVVGNNVYVNDASQNLSHADDDALRLVKTLNARLPETRVRLLVEPDDETRSKFQLGEDQVEGHTLAAPITSPSWDSLVRTMEAVQQEAETLLRAGRELVVLFYFAGHHTVGGELHLKDKTLPGYELETLLQWANNRKGVLRLDWRDACTSASSLSMRTLSKNTQIVGTEEKVIEYEKLKGSLLTSLLVTGLSGAAARPGEPFVTIRGLADWLRQQLSPHLKVRIEGPSRWRSPDGDEPWALLPHQGVMVPPSFRPGALQLWRQLEAQAPRLEHAWWHHQNVRERIGLEPGTYRLVQLLSYEDFGEHLWDSSWSGAKQLLLHSTGLTPARYYTFSVGMTTEQAPGARSSAWVTPRGTGTLALLSPASRGDTSKLRERLQQLEQTLPGISSLELTQVAESQEVMLSSEYYNRELSPRVHEGLTDGFSVHVYGKASSAAPPDGTYWLCPSDKSECGLSMGFSREVPIFFYDPLALNMRFGLRYETSQRQGALTLSDKTYEFYARHGLGLGAGMLARGRLGPFLVGLEESLWWTPTTLWERQALLLDAQTPGLLLRGALESALSLKLRLGPLLHVGPRLSWVMPLTLPNGSGWNAEGWYPQGYSESSAYGQVGVEFTVKTP